MASSIAHELAKKQKEISVAEFFERNKHILGFDTETRAVITAVKEAVDNALDACEESEILPENLEYWSWLSFLRRPIFLLCK